MWRMTPGEWAAYVDGLLERRIDMMWGPAMICSMVSGFGKDPRPPLAFINPDWQANDDGPPSKEERFAQYLRARAAAREAARKQYEKWADGLGLARVPLV